MVGTPKNHADLTEEDFEIINGILLRCGALLYNVRAQYHTPLEYAQKVISKRIKSNQNLAIIRLLYNANNNVDETLIFNDEQNKELAKVMLDGNQYDQIDITTSGDEKIQHDKYIPSPRMTEALQTLDALGVRRNIKDRKEIKSLLGKSHPGKPETHDPIGVMLDRRPSAYRITDGFQKLKKTAAKPKAQKLLYKQLKESNLLYRYEKFMIEALYHAIKMDEGTAKKMIKATDSVPVKDSSITSIRNKVLILNDSQLQDSAAKDAEYNVQRRKDDDFYSLLGVFHL
jgi:hypothetical protein